MSDLKLPTPEEIETAWRAIDAAGPMAHDTVTLGVFAMRNRRLQAVIERLTSLVITALHVEESNRHMVEPMIMACVMTGLNYGLRIADIRVKAANGGKA